MSSTSHHQEKPSLVVHEALGPAIGRTERVPGPFRCHRGGRILTVRLPEGNLEGDARRVRSVPASDVDPETHESGQTVRDDRCSGWPDAALEPWDHKRV